MMAWSNAAAKVRVIAVSGLASCTVCSSLISFRLLWNDVDRIEALRCPRCGGSLEPHLDSLHPEMELLGPAAESGAAEASAGEPGL